MLSETKKKIPRQEDRKKRKIFKSKSGQAGGDLRKEIRSAEEAGGLLSIQKRKGVGSRKMKMRDIHFVKR